MRSTHFTAITVVALLLTAVAVAQSDYSTADFSATFNGQVEVSGPTRNTANTSTYVSYSSHDSQGIEEFVEVRTIDHDIPVDLTSTRFYRNQVSTSANATEELLADKNSDGDYQGHPYSYGCYRLKFQSGGDYYHLARYIVVSPRKEISIEMLIPTSIINNIATDPNGAYTIWREFEYTLNIK